MPLKSPTMFCLINGLADDDASTLKQINECAARLNEMRAVEINASGPFAQSKLAWKLASYQHALLHRLVSLVSGAASCWNSHDQISTMLSTRAVMETISIIYYIVTKVDALVETDNLSEIDRIVQNGLFSSRDPEWISDQPHIKATNILTYINRFDAYISGFKTHYDKLSERCHPNAQGHNFMFSTLDRETGTIRFDDQRKSLANTRLIIAGLFPLLIIEKYNSNLTELVWKVAEVQHHMAPIQPATSEPE